MTDTLNLLLIVSHALIVKQQQKILCFVQREDGGNMSDTGETDPQ